MKNLNNQTREIKRIFYILSYLLFHTYLGFGQAIPYNFDVSSYNINYEIDANKKIFKSAQNIFIKNASSNSLYQINFLLHPDLIIDEIAIQDSLNKNLPIKRWKKAGMTKIFKNELQIIEVETKKKLASGKQYMFHLEYQMQSNAFKDSSQISENNLDLVISPGLSYAIGPTTGHIAIFNRNIIAPFQLSIKYPEGNLCCVPGNFISSERKGNYIIESYSSQISSIPTFSCAFYEKKTKKVGELTFEYYLYPGQNFVNEMIDIPAQFVQLYTSTFGDIGTDVYRLGNIGAIDSKILSLENKGNVVYLSDLLTRYYTYEEGVKYMFVGLIGHELFHNWNIFSVNWTGKLTDWFEEGGANFLATWASEQIVGEDFSVSGRMHFTSAYSGEMGSRGYDAKETLESVSKNNSGDPELMLIYYYGALVWEQLRQKIGDEVLLAGLEDFFRKYRFKTATYQDFLLCLQAKASVNVEEYLNQWIKNNAIIDLSIGNVSTQKKGDFYNSEIEIMVDSDRDYELITSIGYKTSLEDEIVIIDLHTIRKGIHKVNFQSKEEPVFIQIDPNCLVPQINLDNNIWSQ
jgi:hypothetical protein